MTLLLNFAWNLNRALLSGFQRLLKFPCCRFLFRRAALRLLCHLEVARTRLAGQDSLFEQSAVLVVSYAVDFAHFAVFLRLVASHSSPHSLQVLHHLFGRPQRIFCFQDLPLLLAKEDEGGQRAFWWHAFDE